MLVRLLALLLASTVALAATAPVVVQASPEVGADDPRALADRAEALLFSDPEEAGRLIARAVPLVQGAEHAATRARLLLLDAVRLESTGRPAEARVRAEDALVVARRERLGESHARGLSIAARLARAQGDSRAALDLLAELRTLPVALREPEALAELARLAAEHGRYDLCLEHGAAARLAFARRGDWRTSVELETLVARCLLELGDVAHGRSLLHNVANVYEVRLSRLDARPAHEALVHALLGKAARLHGDPATARHHLRLAAELAEPHDRPEIDETIDFELAWLALREERPEDALVALAPLTTGLARRSPEHVARVRALEARTLLAAGRPADAEALRADVERGVDGMPWRDARLGALRLLADLARVRGDAEEAVARLEHLDREHARGAAAVELGALARSDQRARAAVQSATRLRDVEDQLGATIDSRTRIFAGVLAVLGLLAAGLATFALRARRRSAQLSDTVRESQTRQLDAESTLAFISHDLRSPLTTIRAASELLSLELPSDQRRLLHLIESGSQRMEEILEAMLALVQYKALPEGEPMHEDVDVAEMAADVLEESRQASDEKNLRLRVERPETPVVLRTEPVLFRQIVQNLVSNAVKYSPRDEVVLVRVLRRDDGGASLSVEDRGPGIPVEDREHLWSLFGRTSAVPTGGEKSTGVGLALAKSISEALGCSIEVDCGAHGRGAVFRLDLTGLVAGGESTYELPRPSGRADAPAEPTRAR